MRLAEGFFARPSMEVAQDLIGRRLVRQISGKKYTAMITETGAYRGGNREGLRYGPGKVYVAIFRGGNATLCVGTEAQDVPAVVTIRKAYPLEGLEADLGGSARLTNALHINKQLDGKSISDDELYIEGISVEPSRIRFVAPRMEKMADNCLGYYRLG